MKKRCKNCKKHHTYACSPDCDNYSLFEKKGKEKRVYVDGTISLTGQEIEALCESLEEWSEFMRKQDSDTCFYRMVQGLGEAWKKLNENIKPENQQ